MARSIYNTAQELAKDQYTANIIDMDAKMVDGGAEIAKLESKKICEPTLIPFVR